MGRFAYDTLCPMKIREMTPPDLTAVAELYLAANPFASEKEIRTWTSGGLNARPRMNLVAQVRGRIIGAISSTVPDKRTMCIEDIAVLPTYRRKGVGTALMKKMLDHAKESGFKKAVLYVHWQNSAAITLLS